MGIEKNLTYELHRPKELGDATTMDQVRRLLPKDQFALWLASRERAGTAGPMMVGGQVSQMTGAQVDELYTKALLGGANPCYVDEETGQVFMGEYVLVPVREND
jgi:hypothetical protein